MKIEPEKVKAVEQYFEDYKNILLETDFRNFTIRFILNSCYDCKLTDRQLRAAIQELRLSGRLTCLIATSKGYKFAANTQEIETYLKKLHREAMNFHKLFSAVKHQAEQQFGLQLKFDFYNELYKQQNDEKV